ncbi:hypothetical protein KSP39_PZI023994 [Platanthera zijinensis]|uniref:Dirigent protein n=1 Tax=Platanthera zijinensis TaxID=2320716 RepID=A0AAP0FT83_9ASPA
MSPPMAKLLVLLLSIHAVSLRTTAGGNPIPPTRLLQSTKPSPFVGEKEKLSHLRLFWHDIVSGPRPTAVSVAGGAATNSSSTLFGAVFVIDDPLTVGPEMSSGIVGRAQGLYASAALETVGILMAMNFVFVEGKYNGSTVAVMGRNQVFATVREMPIVGGSGLFRLARGYVQARTHYFDAKSGDAVVEYNCYVIHY